MNEQNRRRAFRILDRLDALEKSNPEQFNALYEEWIACKSDKEKMDFLERVRAQLSLEVN